MEDALSSLLESGLIPDMSTAKEPQRKKRCYSRFSTKCKLNDSPDVAVRLSIKSLMKLIYSSIDCS